MKRFDTIAASQKHGTRSCYVRGCKCEECRAANLVYEKKRAAERAAIAAAAPIPPLYEERMWRGKLRKKHVCAGVNGTPCPGKRILKANSSGNVCHICRDRVAFEGYVSAEKAREHLKMLSRNGVGRRAVSQVTALGDTTVTHILNGKSRFIRAKTEQLILSVTPDDRADGALVDAKESWRLINELVNVAKIPRMRIARMMGSRASNGLQLAKTNITKGNADAVKAVHEKVFKDLKANKGMSIFVARKMIAEILEEGVTRRQLAQHMGYGRGLKLVVYDRCIDKTISEKLTDAHHYFTGGERPKKQEEPLCTACGFGHDKATRMMRVGRALPKSSEELREMFSCYYPPSNGDPQVQKSVDRRFSFDMISLGADVIEGTKGRKDAIWGIVRPTPAPGTTRRIPGSGQARPHQPSATAP